MIAVLEFAVCILEFASGIVYFSEWAMLVTGNA